MRREESTDPVGFTSVIRSELFSMQFQSDVRARSRPPSLTGVRAGPLDVLRYCGTGEQWGGRDRQLIATDRADYYVICAPVSARLAVQQNGKSAELRCGSFAVVSTSRPFHARIRSDVDGEHFAAVHVRVPGPLLRQRIPYIDELCGAEVRALPGKSRMMLSLFELALSDGPYLSADERARLGDGLFEAVTEVAMSLTATMAPPLPRHSAQQRTVDGAQAFIASHLSDPELDPAAVAAHCGVSTRFLHASFAARSAQSVAQLIRESRLQACRASLREARLRERTIIQIAGDWGFDDPAHFCRLYKARFGKTPREDR